MAAKITLTGKRISPIVTTEDYHRFEMRETGSPTAPKGLPVANAILYSVFIGITPGKTLDILNLPEDQFFLIQGEIILGGLSQELCPGQIGVIAFQTTLHQAKEKKALKSKPLTPEPIIDTDVRTELHAKFKGVCSSCSAKLDKRLAKSKRLDPNLPPTLENLRLICPDCKNKRPDINGIPINLNVINTLKNIGMDQKHIDDFFSNFYEKFVLINFNERKGSRIYWVPGKLPIESFVVIENEIQSVKIARSRLAYNQTNKLQIPETE